MIELYRPDQKTLSVEVEILGRHHHLRLCAKLAAVKSSRMNSLLYPNMTTFVYYEKEERL
jgi:hypothetical protein